MMQAGRIEELVSVAQAAQLKGVSTRAVRRRIYDGHMPGVTLADRLFVRKADLDDWEVQRWRQEQERMTGARLPANRRWVVSWGYAGQQEQFRLKRDAIAFVRTLTQEGKAENVRVAEALT